MQQTSCHLTFLYAVLRLLKTFLGVGVRDLRAPGK